MSDTRRRYRIGVDVGGTFTDAAVFDDATGSLRYAKAPSTPSDPAQAVLDVLERLGVDLGEVQRFIHGITIGTNAVLEGRGAEVWMLTTAGFRDVLEIARTNRTVLYDITALKPPPLVPRGRTLEIDERMAFDGSVLRPLDLDRARAAVQSLPPGAAVAVCFLHSYANPNHEQAVAALARERTDGNGTQAGFVTASSEVLPELREYERFNTTALNAYIGPLIDGYLVRLQASIAARGYRSPVFIMTSNGGVATAERARRLPVSTVLSGPAGGVAAAAHLGRRLASFAEIADELDRLEAQARRSLEAEGVSPEDFSSRRALGMRYLGQSWEIDVDVPPDMVTVEALEAAFHETHERRFGHRNDGETEVVSFRLTGVGRGRKPAFGAWRVPGDLAGARVETRAVYFGGRFFDTPVLARDRLPAGVSHAGPAIVEEEGATTVVPPQWRFRVLDSGDLLMESGEA